MTNELARAIAVALDFACDLDMYVDEDPCGQEINSILTDILVRADIEVDDEERKIILKEFHQLQDVGI